MHPLIFEFPNWIPLLGGKGLHTYGLMAALGFLAGLWWLRREAKRVGIDPEKLTDLFFYVVLAAIVGSRLLYVFVSVPEWWTDPLVFFRFWEGGLVFYGGLIGAVGVGIWYCRKYRLSFLTVADLFAPATSLGHIFGRFGCFAAGCCYGKEAPVGSFFAVLFPDGPFSIAPHTYPVYATQLMEAFGEFVIFSILFLFRKKKKFDGEIFLLYIILYPILRSFLEIYRGDKIRGFLIEDVLSTSQFISILWVLVALVSWLKIRKTARA